MEEGLNKQPIIKTEEEFVFVDKYNVKTEPIEKKEEPERVAFNDIEASSKNMGIYIYLIFDILFFFKSMRSIMLQLL